MDWKKVLLFAGGALFGSAGVRALTSKDAKKVYTQCTAAGLRVKEYVMDTAQCVQENAEDILAEAKEINREREAAEEECVFADEAVVSE